MAGRAGFNLVVDLPYPITTTADGHRLVRATLAGVHLQCHGDGGEGLSGQRDRSIPARHQPIDDFGSLQEAEAFADRMREIDAGWSRLACAAAREMDVPERYLIDRNHLREAGQDSPSLSSVGENDRKLATAIA